MLIGGTERTPAKDQGAVAILVAIFSVAMFGFAAIIVDLGAARSTSNDAQNAADASVLAAANALYATNPSSPDFTAAVQAAKDYAESNYGTGPSEWLAPGCTDPGRLAYTFPAGGTECVSFEPESNPTKLRVRIPPRRVGSFFGGIVGYDGLTISTIAEASTGEVQPDCVLCVLGHGAGPMTRHRFDRTQLTVTGGDIWVNGDLELPLTSSITTGAGRKTSIGGQLSPTSPSINGEWEQDLGDVTDPLADMDLPVDPATPLKTNPCVDGAGTYGDINIPNTTTTCELDDDEGDLYVFTKRFHVEHNVVDFNANGVTLYFKCGADCGGPEGSRLDLHSTNFHLTAPATGLRRGLSIVYDRSNSNKLGLGRPIPDGSPVHAVTGTIYAPESDLEPPPDVCGQAFRSMVIVDDIMGADHCLSLAYSSADNVPVPNDSRRVGLSK